MGSDRFAKISAESLARHQLRALVDDAADMSDVVIHGHVDLLAVADQVLGAAIEHLQPTRKSWSRWLTRRCADGNELKRLNRRRDT